MKHTILITSAGSGVSQNVLETLSHRRQGLFIIGTDASPDTPVYGCDKVYLLPVSERPPSAFAEELSRIIDTESPDLIIPGRDVDVIILSMIKEMFPGEEHRFLAGTPALGEMMEDKWLSHLFSKEQSLPFAESILFDPVNHKSEVDRFVTKQGFPLILKPRKGFASKNVTLVTNRGQLDRTDSHGSMVLQEYLGDAEKVACFQDTLSTDGLPLFYSLEEEKFSVQLYIGRSGSLKGSFVTAHKMVNGVSAGVIPVETTDLTRVIDSIREVFSRHGWHGPLNIQLQKSSNSGELKIYEFNGRFTGATAARYFLGYDEFGLAMEDVCGVDLARDRRFGSQRSVVRQAFVSEIPDVHAGVLARRRQWEA